MAYRWLGRRIWMAATAGFGMSPGTGLAATDAALLPRNLSPWGMFESADIVVKAVMIGLAFASLVTWTIWLAKTIEIRRKTVLARQRIGLLERDKVDFVVGPIFSNILLAIHRPVTDSKTFLISPNAGPSSFAGKECNPFFYVTSYQNDQVHEILGKVAQDRGYKRVYLLVPNYQAGRDSVAGFKLDYKGEIVEESYTPLNTLDFQPELSKIAALKPDALFTFMPGGMGVNLVKQYKQAGATVPVLSVFTVDESTLPAQQDAAVGMFGGANWAPDLDNPQSKKFVAAYEAAYNGVPGTYAMQAYDAALLIDSAVKAVKGDLSNKDAVAAALRKADFTSLRGNFKFNNNGYPIQDFYLTKVAKRPDGKFQTEIVEKVFSNYGDRYAKDCAAK